jgi:hypothetical protein
MVSTETLALNADVSAKLAAVLDTEGPAFLNVRSIRRRVTPQVRFGRPNEDADPTR